MHGECENRPIGPYEDGFVATIRMVQNIAGMCPRNNPRALVLGSRGANISTIILAGIRMGRSVISTMIGYIDPPSFPSFIPSSWGLGRGFSGKNLA